MPSDPIVDMVGTAALKVHTTPTTDTAQDTDTGLGGQAIISDTDGEGLIVLARASPRRTLNGGSWPSPPLLVSAFSSIELYAKGD